MLYSMTRQEKAIRNITNPLKARAQYKKAALKSGRLFSSRWCEYNIMEGDPIPSAPGVYCIYHFGQFLYIGCSGNVRSRVLTHASQIIHRPSAKQDWPMGSMHYTVKVRWAVSKVKEVFREIRLIKRLSPPMNTRHIGKL